MQKPNVAIVHYSNLFLAPYVYKYAEYLNDFGIKFDLIYWKRESSEELPPVGVQKIYCYENRLSPTLPRHKKIKDFLCYTNFAIDKIKENHYNRLILLNTYSALLMSWYLSFSYQGKYAIDTRDYWYEKNPLIFKIQKSVFAKASLRVISSDGYREFLPKMDYVVMHNETQIPQEVIEQFRFKKNFNTAPICISQIGFIRFLDQNCKLINAFKNDKRFKLLFAGSNSESLQSFCIKNKVTNCELRNKFLPEMTLNFYSETDLIHNVYGNGIDLDQAISNKLYYCAKLGLPILVSPNTYMQKIVLKYGLGFTVDFSDAELPDKLYEYYQNLDRKQFLIHCDRFLEAVNLDMLTLKSALKSFIL